MKALLRRILNTRVYQRSSVYPKEKRPPPERFAVQSLRRLSRHQLLQSIGRATDFDFVFRFLPEEGAEAGAEDPSEMTGKPEEQEYDAREDFLVQVQRSDSPVERALLRLNGSVFNDSIGGGKRLTAVLERRFTEADRIRWLFLSTLSRSPTRSETDRFADYVRAAPDPYAAYADVLWTLLNSSEFGVNR